MYPNLKAEMARHSVTAEDIAKATGRSVVWVRDRLQGSAALPIEVAKEIRDNFFMNLSLDYLFSTSPYLGGAENEL